MIQYLGVPYDTGNPPCCVLQLSFQSITSFVGSVFHYDQFAFAKNRAIPTIYAKNGAILGNTKGFSQVFLINVLMS